jgi:hypothetical protein
MHEKNSQEKLLYEYRFSKSMTGIYQVFFFIVHFHKIQSFSKILRETTPKSIDI